LSLTIYLNGQFVKEEEAKISVFDHGLLYGDGIFEGIRAYNGRVFKLEEHIDRLYEGLQVLALPVPLNKEEMAEVVRSTCRINNLKEAYIRLVVTRGCGDLGLDPNKCSTPNIFCIASAIQLYPPEMYEKGMEIATVATRRNAPDALNPRLKSLNYLNNILAKMEATRRGLPEALLLNREGYVSEATGDNIFIYKTGILYTPALYLGVLKGITRDTVIELAKIEGIEVKETCFTLHDVYTADEVFLTGTAAEVVPVCCVDGRVIGSGQAGTITKKLMKLYHNLTQNNGSKI